MSDVAVMQAVHLDGFLIRLQPCRPLAVGLLPRAVSIDPAFSQRFIGKIAGCDWADSIGSMNGENHFEEALLLGYGIPAAVMGWLTVRLSLLRSGSALHRMHQEPLCQA